MSLLCHSSGNSVSTTCTTPTPCTACMEKHQPTNLGDDLSQARVAHDQPASGRDAVGLVLELLRVDVIEVFEPVGEGPQSETRLEPGHLR